MPYYKLPQFFAAAFLCLNRWLNFRWRSIAKFRKQLKRMFLSKMRYIFFRCLLASIMNKRVTHIKFFTNQHHLMANFTINTIAFLNGKIICLQENNKFILLETNYNS